MNTNPKGLYNKQENNNGRTPATYNISSQNYTTGFVHLALCVTAGWAIHQTHYRSSPLAMGCFVFMLAHSLLGVIRYTHPGELFYVKKLYRYSFSLCQKTTLALIITQLSLKLFFSIEYSFSHLLITLIPFLLDVLNVDQNELATTITLIINSCSLAYLSATKEKYWGIGLATLSTINYFGLNRISDRYEVPKSDLFTIGQIFFTIFSVNCILE